ncbi:MAG: hypothetical protein ACSHWS_16930, partial [Sulfitobacter sp.]
GCVDACGGGDGRGCGVTKASVKPSVALPILLGILGLIIGPFIAAEQGWDFGVAGGLETLGQDLFKGAVVFAAGGVCLGLILNFIIHLSNKQKGE